MKTKTSRITVAIALLLAIFTDSCKKDTYVAIAGVCPLVVSTNPVRNETGVPLNKMISVTFNEKMNPATIVPAAFSLIGDITVQGTLVYDPAGVTMNFTPTKKLTASTTYTGRVSSSVKDPNGNALQTDYVWSFTTGFVDSIRPTVISTDPINNAIKVAVGKIVTATFSEKMDSTSINAGSFLIKQGSTSIAGLVNYSGVTASFAPSANLIAGKTYSATITTAAKDPTGNTLATNYNWVFTTDSTNIAPTVISTSPITNETNVVLNKVISANFSQFMDGTTLSNATFLLKNGSTSITGIVTYAGTTAFFTPSGPLTSGTTYVATITTGAKNPLGIPLAADYSWSFSTGTQTLSPPPINLNSALRFGILAGVGISNNAGFSEIHDLDVGISPGVRSSVTGFPPAIIINGAIYASDDINPPGVAAMLIAAKQDLTNAYLAAEGATSPAPVSVNGDLGGTTLAPGIYKSTSSLLIQSGDLTLDAQGNPNAYWIFQVASAFTTVGGAGGNIILAGGAQAQNIFWQTGSSATIGGFTSFKGNVLALTSITMNSGAVAVGRMLAINGAVVMTSTNKIYKP
ncbi:MAG: Ig-like domain-containing protein [bacterium]|nr:Ig-like domain-containing protein [bacterium]